MSSEDHGTEPQSGADAPLIRALRRVLRPLVRLLIARSIPFTNVADLLRWVYVDVASREFGIEGKPQTDSRVSLLTGVHRREVKRLRRHTSPSYRAPKSATLGAQLISRWTTLPEFQTEARQPRPLPYMSADVGAVTFESLVRGVSTDIRPRVVLDEWTRLGLAHVDDDDIVHLDVDAFVPSQGDEELAYYFGRNLHDHVAAGSHNLIGEGRPFLERSVSYNHLATESVGEIAELARAEAMRALRVVNERAQDLQRRDKDSPDADQRINFGTYFFSESVAADGEDDGD